MATKPSLDEAEVLARQMILRGEDQEAIERKLAECDLGASNPSVEYKAQKAIVERRVAVEEVGEASSAPAEDAKPPEVVTARHAIANPRPRTLGLWGELLVPGEAAGPIGRGGVGKTSFTRTILLRSAEGTGEFLDRPFHAGPVRWLYLTREGNGGYWLDRLGLAAKALGTSEEALDRIHLWGYADDCGLYLSTPADVDVIGDKLRELSEAGTPINALALDPWSDFKAGSDNDDEAMAAGFAGVKKLCREHGVAGWVPHHASQNGEGLDAGRGSTKYEGTVNAQMNLTDSVKDPKGKALPETVRKLQIVKNRYGRKTTHYLDFDEDTEVYSERLKPGLAADTLAVLRDAEDGTATIKAISKAAKASPSGARKAINDLIEEGKVEAAGEGKRDVPYRLTEAGKSTAGLGC